MIRTKERLLSAVLALVLATSSLSMRAFAETEADSVEEAPTVEVVEAITEGEVAEEDLSAQASEPGDDSVLDELIVEEPVANSDEMPASEPEDPQDEPDLLAAATTEDEYDHHDISNATVTIEDVTYTGDYLEPVPVVVTEGYQLEPDYDFNCDYENNIDAGTATVVIYGTGDFYGDITASFTIKARPIAKATVTGVVNKTYTGKALKQAPEVELNGQYLELGVDYTLSYKSNVNAGTATVIIKGKGNYTGTINKSFKIAQASISKASVAKVGTQAWTGKVIKPKPVVKYGGKTIKLGTDYTLSYKNNKKAGATATITITGKGNFKGTKTVTFKIGPKTGAWKKSGGRWWYRYKDGTYPKSEWKRIDGSWYYFDGSGWMVTGWRSVSGTWYYFNSGGAMVTGWKSISGSWYYFDSNGAMARNRWVGDYYLGSSGAMLRNTTTPDGYRVDSNGKWIRGSSGSGGSGSYDIVYWVPNGEVWHSTPNCRSLARSSGIQSGTIAQSGKSRGCKNCT